MSEVTSLLPGGLDLSNFSIKSLSKKTMMMSMIMVMIMIMIMMMTMTMTMTFVFCISDPF